MSPNISLMKFSKKIKKVLFTILLCLIFFISLFLIDNFFSIKNVQIVSDRKFSLANKEELVNKNLLLLNQEQISKKIIKENYLLKTAVVEKVFPNNLKITVSFYEPCVSLVVNNGYFNLSCDGRILMKSKNILQYLPVINYYQKLNSGSFQTGDWIDFEDIKKTFYFINKLKEINLNLLTVDIKGQDMLVFNLIDDKQIVFSDNKEMELQDYQLELIIKQFKIEGKNFKKIDLRFEKPVIQF